MKSGHVSKRLCPLSSVDFSSVSNLIETLACWNGCIQWLSDIYNAEKYNLVKRPEYCSSQVNVRLPEVQTWLEEYAVEKRDSTEGILEADRGRECDEVSETSVNN